SVRIDAAISLIAEFLAPLTGMEPLRRWPPWMTMLSMGVGMILGGSDPYGPANRLSSKADGGRERPERRRTDDFQLLSLGDLAPPAPGALRRRRLALKAAARRAARSTLAEAAGAAFARVEGDESASRRVSSASLVGLFMNTADRAQRF